MADVQVTSEERADDMFYRSGSGPTKSVTLTVRLAVPVDATKEDVIQEYARWLSDDPGDAVPCTQVTDETGAELPDAPESDDES